MTAHPVAVPFHRPSLTTDERRAVLDVLDSGWLTMGERTIMFEARLAEYVGVRHAVAVNSATAALHLALEGLGIGPDDEVIVPTYTFASCAEVVTYLGATPVLADVDRRTLNLSLETVVPRASDRTRAIIVVHFGGLVADIEPILAWAAPRGVAIVEDAAHALPARIGEQHAGSFGRAGAFSFYATKTVTTGEGGMLVTADDRLADRARLMRLHGITRSAWRRYADAGAWWYDIEAPGFKYNLTDLAAALGLVQLERAGSMRARREEVARHYDAAFSEEPLASLVEAPAGPRPGGTHAWHLYALRLNLDRIAVDRAAVVERLGQLGIGTSVHFIPLHMHSYYRDRFGHAPEDLPVAAAEFLREISLPIYPDLAAHDRDRVVDALRAVLLEAAR